MQRFCKEAIAWKVLRHPNVLPLLGAELSLGILRPPNLVMVSDWMADGNINDFVKSHPKVDRLTLVGSLFKALLFSHDDYKIPSSLVSLRG